MHYFSPWCDHCKELATEWDALAEVLKNNEEVILAEMDATVNELSHTLVQSFPTIRLYRKGRAYPYSEYKEYNGGRKQAFLLCKIFWSNNAIVTFKDEITIVYKIIYTMKVQWKV